MRKLKDVDHFDGIDKDVACKVWVVGHYGRDRAYCTVAESREMAALAYTAMVGSEGLEVPLGRIWVKDENQIESLPLTGATDQSIRNWLDEDLSRAKRLQAAVKQLKAVVS